MWGPPACRPPRFPMTAESSALRRPRTTTGYWIVTNDGDVAACGDAPYLGEQTALNAPDRRHRRDAGWGWLLPRRLRRWCLHLRRCTVPGARRDPSSLNDPVIGMTVDRATGGYWLVATDGGIFAYDAPFLGSTGSMTLNEPVVGMAACEAMGTGTGWWPPMAASSRMAFRIGDRPARSISTSRWSECPQMQSLVATGSSRPTAGSLPSTLRSTDQPAALP